MSLTGWTHRASGNPDRVIFNADKRAELELLIRPSYHPLHSATPGVFRGVDVAIPADGALAYAAVLSFNSREAVVAFADLIGDILETFKRAADAEAARQPTPSPADLARAVGR